MTEPIQISRQTVRRFVLGKQGLWPGRRWEGKSGTRLAMVACEHLQLDPLVILARSHDLMLHSRVAGYQPRFFDELTYEERLFFDWGGWLAVRPMHELPYWRALMRRERALPRIRMIEEFHGAAIVEMRDALRERGMLANRDFTAGARHAVDSYRGRKDSAVALYYLWRTGEAMTHHRNRFERVYAPAESVAPARLLTPAGDDETDQFMVRKAIAFAGIGRTGRFSTALSRSVTKREERALEQALIDAGDLAWVGVEGGRADNFVLVSDLDLLDDVASGRVPASWAPIDTTTEEEVTLLSPLDPVVARGRAKVLFDFEYVWEIYKKQELVQFGRYTMPILWGDDLAGRIDARIDRRSHTLVINGIWLERAADTRATRFRDALREGVRRAMTFLGADRVDATGIDNATLRSRISSLNGRGRR